MTEKAGRLLKETAPQPSTSSGATPVGLPYHKVFVSEWDGTKYVKASDWMDPIREEVRPLIEAAAKDYAEKNTGWPKRAEPCEKSS